MIPLNAPSVDGRDTDTVLAQFQNRRYGYLPRWNPPAASSGAAMGPIFAQLITAILQRLNQAPAKNKLAFLDLLGIRLIAAQPARAPIVFSLTSGASDCSAPEGTQVAAPPPAGSTNQIVFSTEQDAAVAAANLSEVVSLWPGRDQYLDCSAAFAAGQPFTLFQHLQMQPTDHIIYLAHSVFLAFAGNVTLKLTFELSQGSTSPLEIAWEYWDGQVWRGFLSAEASCLDPATQGLDGTNGLTESGSFQLQAQGTQTAPTTVNGVSSSWIRGRLTQTLPPDPRQLLPEAETIRLSTQIDQTLESTSAQASFVTALALVDGNNKALAGIAISASAGAGPFFVGTTDSLGIAVLPTLLVSTEQYTFTVNSQGAPCTSNGYTPSQPTISSIQLQFASGATPPVTVTENPAGLPNTVTLLNEVGAPLENAVISIALPNSGSSSTLSISPTANTTDATGRVSFTGTPSIGTTYEVTVNYYGATQTANLVYSGTPSPSASSFQILVSIKLKGLALDEAFNDGNSLDVTKAFYPFGQGPSVGSVFYFKQTEVFSKPGASVRIYIDVASPDPLPYLATLLNHVVNWEYWNGQDWTLFYQSSNTNGTTGDFSVTEVIEFTIPVDVRATTVNNDQGLWMRARILSGKFGYLQSIVIPAAGGATQTISYPVTQAPVVADIRIGYTWTKGPLPLENVLTYNDFQFEDHTSDALWPGTPFTPFQPVSDVTPAVYLGFDKQLPVNNYGVYLDIVEQSGVEQGPAMIWEYWDGGEWSTVSDEDETQNLALPGMITFLPDADSEPLARFDNPLYWLRGRLKEDEPPNETLVTNIFTNAVWASQYQTFQDSPLGASTGVPSQLFQFTQIPVLPGQEIEVQELSGPRANTEWRTLALQLAPDDPDIISELEALLAAEGPQTDIILGDVHLVRDKTKSVTAVWIQWQEVDNFFDSGPNDRVYVLDHALGRLFFGDGNLGMIPPLGALIQATSFLSGGGLAGNVEASTITQLLGALAGISGVTNPRAAEGGADGETLQEYQLRAPLTLRDRGRALVAQDYETMAHEASAGVAIARAMGPCDPSGRPVPGWITVMIIPQSNDPQPTPSAGLRQDVLNYLLARAPADVVASQRINVIGPTYLPVDVTATLAPSDPAQAGTVEQDALDALAAFLNPLTGGPGGLGWDVGRGLYASDIATVLGGVAGVDYVQELALYVNNVLQGDQVQVPAGQIVVAGQFKISLILPVTY